MAFVKRTTYYSTTILRTTWSEGDPDLDLGPGDCDLRLGDPECDLDLGLGDLDRDSLRDPSLEFNPISLALRNCTRSCLKTSSLNFISPIFVAFSVDRFSSSTILALAPCNDPSSVELLIFSFVRETSTSRVGCSPSSSSRRQR